MLYLCKQLRSIDAVIGLLILGAWAAFMGYCFWGLAVFAFKGITGSL
jgi:hypothetical protein